MQIPGLYDHRLWFSGSGGISRTYISDKQSWNSHCMHACAHTTPTTGILPAPVYISRPHCEKHCHEDWKDRVHLF